MKSEKNQEVFLPTTIAAQQKQHTIKENIEFSGIGLFTGKNVFIRLIPAKENSGIIFRRIDLPGSPEIEASVHNVVDTPRCTILGNNKLIVRTVEHLLAATYALGIDNLIIEVDGDEIPAGDGSAAFFVEKINNAQIQKQKTPYFTYNLSSTVVFSEGNMHMIAIPSDEFKISYTLHYPNSNCLDAQYVSFLINPKSFYEEIAFSRTFSIYEEIEPLLEKGIIKGGGLDNAVIIKNDKILNPEGVRYNNEMARHKVLDLIGDLSLMGKRFTAHIIAIKSGHFANISFAKILEKKLKQRLFE